MKEGTALCCIPPHYDLYTSRLTVQKTLTTASHFIIGTVSGSQCSVFMKIGSYSSSGEDGGESSDSGSSLILSMLLCKTVFFIQCLYHELPPLFSLHTSLRARSAICIACSKSNSFYKFTTKVVLQLLPN